MREVSFILQYIKKPRTTRGILPSSKYLVNKMVEDIDFKREFRNIPPAYVLNCINYN